MSQQHQLEPTGFTTRTIHAVHDARYDASVPPVYLASTFGTAGEDTTYMYQRGANPTRDDLQATLAALEGAAHAYAYPSGMAATAAALGILEAGDTLLLGMPSYGGTYRFATTELPKRAVKTRFISDFSVLSDDDFTPDVKAVFLETPTNPTLQVTDIAAIAELAHRHGALLIVDNTFMTPYFQNPLKLGADVVVHSGTKYLSGHNDTVCGFLCSKEQKLAEYFRLISKTTGATLGPFECWLCMRGLKTLAVRMERHQSNALAIARWLKSQECVEKVYFAGLEDNPGYEKNREQARGYSGMISFTVKSAEQAQNILKHVKLITFAESLGGPESLLTYPAVQTHPDVPVEQRERLGITDKLLRLSVGIEDPGDLIADLKQAMER